MERSIGDSHKGNGQDNSVRPRITTTTSVSQTNRQDNEWSVPPIAERGELWEDNE